MPIKKKNPKPAKPINSSFPEIPDESVKEAHKRVSSVPIPKALKQLPCDGQPFVMIRERNLLYVDKTEYIYKLVQRGGFFFLSRPRRFGKSCLLGAMEALSQGKRELFQGLWIDSSGYDFKKYPVVKLTMSGECGTKEELKNTITDKLEDIVAYYGLKLEAASPGGLLERLVRTLKTDTGERVVILIDEYDAPIQAHINDIPNAIKIREVLHDFYSALKTLADDGLLRFMFVTGVTKFAQASIFSVFNNLNDLTLNPEFNGICGFTMEEFETYCADYLPGVLDYQKANGWLPSTDTINDLKKQIMAQYDGYSWNGIDRVLNPFSLIKFLEIRKLLPFWFNTGTPSFLLEFIKGHLLEFTQTENYIMTEDMFGAVDVANLELVPLLFQTGYLTIENFDSPQEYSLKWPNFEVDRAFNVNLLKFLTGQSKKSIDNLRNKIRTALMNIDRDSITECFQDILLWFPFQLHLPFEAFYHAIIFSVLKSFHYEVEAEVSVAEGIYDMSIEIPNGPFYVCEFKYAKIEEKDGKTGAKDGKTEEKGGRSEEKDGRSEEKSSQIILAETLEAIKTRLKSEKFAEKVDHLLTRALDQAKNQIKNRRYEAKARCEKPIVKRMAVAVVGRTDVLVEIY